MNKDNAKDYLPLVQALAEGKVIQSCPFKPTWPSDWSDHEGDIMFNMPANQYRIKPKPRKAWVWWPERFDDLSLEIFEGESSARHYMAQHGGHITEVTE